MRLRSALGLLLLAACLRGAPEAAGTAAGGVQRLRARVVARYPHDPAAFTQGLIWDGRRLLESTGLYGESSLRRVELASGRVEQQVALPGHLFGEGLERVGERLVQLTWREGIARLYDAGSLALVAELRYGGEGWGLCFDGTQLVMSDGSGELSFRDPATLRELRRQPVTLAGEPEVRLLNELECVEGSVYANVLGSDRILRIDPASGAVGATIDAGGLLAPGERAAAEVLNGIAYDAEQRLFYVTGKLWPALFAVQFVAE